ncbi:MAG: CBS domain-containing protein [Actinomycetota bacterium]|nr:CBS domain-containing protein [Actinomycetota bacterium]
MPDSIVKETIREIEPLRTDDSVATAAKRVIELRLPGLPAVDPNGKFAGIFGEREFLAALFPGYMNELFSTAMIKRSIDYTIDRREECATESIQKYLTRDHVLVEDDYSDTQLAELFLHHRVLVIPIATKGRVHAVVTRADYFAAVARRFTEQAES